MLDGAQQLDLRCARRMLSRGARDRRVRRCGTDDDEQVPPREPIGAEVAQPQPQPDQVILDGLRVFADEPQEAEDSPMVTSRYSAKASLNRFPS